MQLGPPFQGISPGAQTPEGEAYGDLEPSLHTQFPPGWGNMARSQGGDMCSRDPESKQKTDKCRC